MVFLQFPAASADAPDPARSDEARNFDVSAHRFCESQRSDHIKLRGALILGSITRNAFSHRSWAQEVEVDALVGLRNRAQEQLAIATFG